MIDRTILKITGILFALQLINVFKSSASRYIIREWFSSGEFGLRQWIKPEFILNISLRQILGLGIIASFTLATFPLGVWLGSFNMAQSYPLRNMIGAILNLATFPATLYMMRNVLEEFEFNTKTNLGIALIVLSKLIIIAGCWLMYRGGLDQ